MRAALLALWLCRAAGLADLHEQCGQLASRGGCAVSREWMAANCALSCAEVLGGAAPPAAAPPPPPAAAAVAPPPAAAAEPPPPSVGLSVSDALGKYAKVLPKDCKGWTGARRRLAAANATDDERGDDDDGGLLRRRLGRKTYVPTKKKRASRENSSESCLWRYGLCCMPWGFVFLLCVGFLSFLPVLSCSELELEGPLHQPPANPRTLTNEPKPKGDQKTYYL